MSRRGTGNRADDRLIYRHRLPVRLWHWLNALSLFVMLMSGFMIFNAHPRLYWGRSGANFDRAWLQITPGHLTIGTIALPTFGLLGVSPGGHFRAFPPIVTIPSSYDLAGARQWHFAFAWLLVVPGIAFLGVGIPRAAFPPRSRAGARRADALAPLARYRGARAACAFRRERLRGATTSSRSSPISG